MVKSDINKKGESEVKRLFRLLLALMICTGMIFAAVSCGEEQVSRKDKDKDEDNYYVGDYITFGTYEQDNDTSNGKEDIEWLVLDKRNDRILVISKYALDCQAYNEEYEDITWEDCTLRSWLNDEFLCSAFSEYERAMIPTVTVEAHANPLYDTDPGYDTQDKVFLLSIDEANEYFDSYEERICNATEYAEAQGVYTWEYDSTNMRSCWWWLRSPGFSQSFAACVDFDGIVNYDGGSVNGVDVAVRPAIWISLY